VQDNISLILPLVFHLASIHLGRDTQHQIHSSVEGPRGSKTPTIEDSCWSVGMVYNSRGLPRVSTAGPGVDEMLQMVLELPLVFSRAFVGYGSGIWHMAHVGLKW
jgi:hypothetical protein